jgi:FkbM family methyltransferase
MPINWNLKDVNKKAVCMSSLLKTSTNIFLNLEPNANLSKEFPYFGYIEIKINDLPTFNMFSNNDDLVAQKYFWHGMNSYERTTLKIWSILSKKSRTTFDIGSYTGIFAISAAVSNPKSKIYAVEAFDMNYSRILVNIRCNNIGNIKVFNSAVSDNDQYVELRLRSGDGVLSTGGSISNNRNKDYALKKNVKSTTLEDLLLKNEISTLDLMKIDIEGYELVALKAFEKLLFLHKPDIIIEVLPSSDGNELYDFFLSGDYYCFYINEKQQSLHLISQVSNNTEPGSRNWFVTCKTKDELNILFKDKVIINGI